MCWGGRGDCCIVCIVCIVCISGRGGDGGAAAAASATQEVGHAAAEPLCRPRCRRAANHSVLCRHRGCVRCNGVHGVAGCWGAWANAVKRQVFGLVAVVTTKAVACACACAGVIQALLFVTRVAFGKSGGCCSVKAPGQAAMEGLRVGAVVECSCSGACGCGAGVVAGGGGCSAVVGVGVGVGVAVTVGVGVGVVGLGGEIGRVCGGIDDCVFVDVNDTTGGSAELAPTGEGGGEGGSDETGDKDKPKFGVFGRVYHPFEYA